VWFVVKGGRRELRQLAQISEIRVKMFLSVLDGNPGFAAGYAEASGASLPQKKFTCKSFGNDYCHRVCLDNQSLSRHGKSSGERGSVMI
jgi:hypothetical protein